MFVALNVRWRWAQGAAAAAPVDQAGTAPPSRPLTTPPPKKPRKWGGVLVVVPQLSLPLGVIK